MFSDHNHDHNHSHDRPDRQAESPFTVLIGRDGSTALDGVPYRVPEGEPVHVAVLDVMHRRARSRGLPVEVVILDRQQDDVTLVEVAPDGSSRVLLHEEHREGQRKEQREEQRKGQRKGQREEQRGEPHAEHLTGRLTGHHEAPAGAERPPATGPAAAVPVTERVPDGEREPDGEGVLEGGRVPDELAELVGLVGHCLDTGALERAAALAFRLREYTARTFGPEHPHTLEAHALEAFVAHRSGNPALAMATSLELARIRHRQGDRRAREEVTRATAAWLRIDDVPSAVDRGRDLLAVLLAVWSRGDQDGRTAAEATLPGLVNRRMRALTHVSDTRATAVA